MPPGLEHSYDQNDNAAADQRSADDSPISQRIEKVVVRPLGLQLNRLGPNFAKPVIKMSWPEPPPLILLPQSNRRFPQCKTRVVLQSAVHLKPVGAVFEQITLRNQN